MYIQKGNCASQNSSKREVETREYSYLHLTSLTDTLNNISVIPKLFSLIPNPGYLSTYYRYLTRLKATLDKTYP